MTHYPEMNATLGALAAARPDIIPVFERFGLDYCCGGHLSLAAACRQRGVEPQEVLDAIAQGGARPAGDMERSWQTATMSELADHIEHTHHVFVRSSLDRLARLVPKVRAAHGASHPELARLEELVGRFTAEMNDHMVREERVLFPWLRRLERTSEIQGGPPWSVRRPIGCMVHDHEDAGRLLAEMREITHDYTPPSGACASYAAMLSTLRDLERDTHIHIHKENNILFPAGVRAEDQRAALSR